MADVDETKKSSLCFRCGVFHEDSNSHQCDDVQTPPKTTTNDNIEESNPKEPEVISETENEDKPKPSLGDGLPYHQRCILICKARIKEAKTIRDKRFWESELQFHEDVEAGKEIEYEDDTDYAAEDYYCHKCHRQFRNEPQRRIRQKTHGLAYDDENESSDDDYYMY